MSVGYWKSPTEATYIAPGDVGQSQHIEGLPFGTRGGMLVRHNFPAEASTSSRSKLRHRQIYPGRASRVSRRRRESESVRLRGVGLSQGMQAKAMASIDVTVPVKAGSHMVGATFLATNYRPSLDHRSSNTSESRSKTTASRNCSITRQSASCRIQGPFTAAASGRLAQHPQSL